MKRLMIPPLLLLIGWCSVEMLYAQPVLDSTEVPQARYGVYGMVGFGSHSADFQALSGVTICCQTTTVGTGTGFSAGLLYEYPVLADLFAGARVGYEYTPVTFTEREPTTLIVNGRATPGAFEHRLKASYGSLVAQPMIRYRVLRDALGRIDLMANTGFGLGLHNWSHYERRETLTEPVGYGIFVGDVDNVRNEYSGEIPGENMFSADFYLGVSADVPLNSDRTLMISPELSYRIGLTPVARTLSWRANDLRLGFAMIYRE